VEANIGASVYCYHAWSEVPKQRRPDRRLNPARTLPCKVGEEPRFGRWHNKVKTRGQQHRVSARGCIEQTASTNLVPCCLDLVPCCLDLVLYRLNISSQFGGVVQYITIQAIGFID
jgi:hypothetical protein